MSIEFYHLNETTPEQDNQDYLVKVDFDFKILFWKTKGASISKPGFYRKNNCGTYQLVYTIEDDSVCWANIPPTYNNHDAACMRDLILNCELLGDDCVDKDYLHSQLLYLLCTDGSNDERNGLVIKHSYSSNLKALLCFIILIEVYSLAQKIDQIKLQEARNSLAHDDHEPLNELIESVLREVPLANSVNQLSNHAGEEIITIVRALALLLVFSSFDRLSDYKKDLEDHGKALIDVAFSHVETSMISYNHMLRILYINLCKSDRSVVPLLLYRIRMSCYTIQETTVSIIIVNDLIEQARKMLILFGSIVNVINPVYQSLYGDSFLYSCEPVMDKNGFYVLPLLGIDERGNGVSFDPRKHEWNEYDYHFYERNSIKKINIKKWQVKNKPLCRIH